MGEGGRAFLDLADAAFPAATLEEWSFMFAERHGVAHEWSAFFQQWDVLLSPTWALPTFAHGADIASPESAMRTLETIRPVTPANLLGLPAAVVPAGHLLMACPSAPSSSPTASVT